MTSSCTISDGTYTVTLTAKDLSISHNFSNPFITVDTPITDAQKIGENIVAINIGFTSDKFTLSFKLTDGPGTFEFQSPTTNYEKIVYMSHYSLNPKTLTLNGTAYTGHIESFDFDWDAGKYNLGNGSLTFTLAQNITME